MAIGPLLYSIGSLPGARDQRYTGKELIGAGLAGFASGVYASGALSRSSRGSTRKVTVARGKAGRKSK